MAYPRLEKTLETLLDNLKNCSIGNYERAKDDIIMFNVGLLCGLKEGRRLAGDDNLADEPRWSEQAQAKEPMRNEAVDHAASEASFEDMCRSECERTRVRQR